MATSGRSSLAVQPQQTGVDALLLRDAVVLQLKIEMLRAEELGHLLRGAPGGLIVPGGQQAGNLAGEAGGERNQARGCAARSRSMSMRGLM